MNTAIAEIVFAAAEVAQALGVDAYSLQKLHPVEFGVPGDWRMNKHGVVVYTERGALALADANEAAAAAMPAEERDAALARSHALRVIVQQRKHTPSRGSWQDRADLQ